MKIKSKLTKIINNTYIGKKVLSDQRFRIVLFAYGCLSWNLIYALFNGLLGILYGSIWFISMFVYYSILGYMRLRVVSGIQKLQYQRQKMIMRLNGVVLIILAAVISGLTYLSFVYPITKTYNKIIMIAIATYTFIIATTAIINIVKAHRQHSPSLIMLRNISCAGATVSVLSLQRSMISTFGNSDSQLASILNGASGLGGFLIVVALGISMIIQSSQSFMPNFVGQENNEHST